MKNKINLNSILSNKKFVSCIVVIALIGIFLIAMSEFVPNEEEEPKISTNENFANETELKISSMVSAITGEKNPEVMVSLSSQIEYVYAKELKANEYETQESYIITRNKDGEEEAVVITQLEPTIKGVVVASKLADNPTIKGNIVSAISTVLDLPSNKVCVVRKIN